MTCSRLLRLMKTNFSRFHIDKNDLFTTITTKLKADLCHCDLHTVSASQLLQMNKQRNKELYDTDVPNDKWSKESVELFNKLNKLGDDWKIHYRAMTEGPDGSRVFPSALKDEPWKFFQYAFFHNSKLQCMKAVVQFGIYLRGPVGLVHGGASATILDAAMGNCVHYCGHRALTGTLNIEYKRPLPLNSATLVEAKIDKIEGRKIFSSGEIKTTDGSAVYSKSTAVFIIV
ncbi:acyl-coenzyme A thioesterase THEM4-like [Dendronephthya gigantea]|uniref:acyl-coenzyme A thioesterase THEM4-like n=1 Tax=Dendronephthya gigantea TaxID=151771 RepID=UPI0010691641|nr:acyl-coenzyme A thioesterase THEM4-like [Dendronephthya gigantea]